MHTDFPQKRFRYEAVRLGQRWLARRKRRGQLGWERRSRLLEALQMPQPSLKSLDPSERIRWKGDDPFEEEVNGCRPDRLYFMSKSIRRIAYSGG